MKGKASTAALRPILEELLSLPKCSPCHPASGPLCAGASLLAPGILCTPAIRREFYCLTDGYFGRGGIPR